MRFLTFHPAHKNSSNFTPPLRVYNADGGEVQAILGNGRHNQIVGHGIDVFKRRAFFRIIPPWPEIDSDKVCCIH
jgi:hypothetical protein